MSFTGPAPDCAEIGPVGENLSFGSAASGSAQFWNSSGPDQLENIPPVALLHNEDPRRSMRTRQKSSKSKDYICYLVWSSPSTPLSFLSPSSATPGTSLYPLIHYLSCNRFCDFYQCFLAAISAGVEHTTYSEAASVPEWRRTMQQEVDAPRKNGTWTLTTFPLGKCTLGCKWVYHIKYKADSAVEHYKARLVVFGNKQKEDIDYSKTFTPVSKMVTVRTLLSLAFACNWDIHQMDVHNSFLHGIWSRRFSFTLGFWSSGPAQVFRLNKSLYGLRQSPRCWFSKFTIALHQCGFVQSYADYFLFTSQIFVGHWNCSK